MVLHMLEYIIILGLLVTVGILAYRLYMTKSYYKYDKDRLNRVEEDFEKNRTASSQELEKLQKIAYTNATTNIWNIDYFLAKSAEAFQQETEASYTLLTFNIMNIGKINQLFGPTEGDKAVYFTAQTLKNTLKGTNIYAQVQSNLFCLLLKNKSESDVLELVHTFTKTLLEYNESIQIKAAFGIYKITDTTMPVMDMINHANLAQKFVKESDDNNYQFFTDELNQRFLENKRMSEEMEQALENHKFVMFLQPMIDLHSYKIVSAEALVRWDYPGKGMLSPYAFLPLFESTSLIQKLDYYMWEECCKTIRRWIDNKMEPVPITMNISPAHLQSEKFIDYLLELMDKYLIQKKWIVLELPERGLTNITSQMGNIINRLHEEGFGMCIDNFGSISSPLNLLKDFPIQRIKLDRSFLARNASSGEGLEIIRYLIAMAKELDFTVITEGIETAEQVKFLVEIGCDIGQGYYFSKPVDLRSFDQLNRTMITTLYRPDEYYPTFEDYERDIDLVVQMFSEVARYEDFFKEEKNEL